MKTKIIKAAVLYACFAMVAVPAIHAQGRGPGGGAPPPPPPAGMSGPAAPNAQGGNSGNNTSSGSNSRASVSKDATQHTATLMPGPTGRWWDDSSTARQVGITHAQQQRMDTIFDANRNALVADYKNLQQQQARLDALSKSSTTDQATLFAAIDAVNQARATLQKTTMQLLLQIRGQLTSSQVTKLESLK